MTCLRAGGSVVPVLSGRPRGARRGDDGQADSPGQSLVEFALVLPVLVLILLLILDFGRAFYAYSVISNAAREGARMGILAPVSDASIRTAVRHFTVGIDYIDDHDIFIWPPWHRSSGGTVTVWVQYDFLPVTPLIDSLLPGHRLRLTSAATMQVE